LEFLLRPEAFREALLEMKKVATTEELQTAIEQHIAQKDGHVGEA